MATSHVLIPLDGSPLAQAALEHALETYECRLTVLNVVTPVATATSEGPVHEIGAERVDAAHVRATELLEDARETGGAVEREVETVVESGDPADTILAYVEEHDVDHIVMGGNSASGGELRRRLLGTVSTAVLGDAAVPVTVVK